MQRREETARQRAERERVAREAREDADFRALLGAIAPSDVDGSTTTPGVFLRLVAKVADQERPKMPAAYASAFAAFLHALLKVAVAEKPEVGLAGLNAQDMKKLLVCYKGQQPVYTLHSNNHALTLYMHSLCTCHHSDLQGIRMSMLKGPELLKSLAAAIKESSAITNLRSDYMVMPRT